MYRASADFKTAVQQDSRAFILDIRYNGNPLDLDLKSFSYKNASNAGNTITIGSAVSASVEFSANKPNFKFFGKELQVSIGLMVRGVLETVPLGFFTCQKPSDDGIDVEVTAYDRMLLFDKPYFSQLTYPASSNQILQELCNVAGVTCVLPSRTVTLSTEPSGYTCREVLVFIAQMLGMYATINRSGSLEFRWYQSYSYEVHDNRCWAPFDKAEDDFTIGMLKCIIGKDPEDPQSEDVTLTAGNTALDGIVFSNPFMTQDILNVAFLQAGNVTFRPASIDIIGDPQIDVGDIITIYDGDTPYLVAVMNLELVFDGGLWMHVECYGEPDEGTEISAQGPLTKAMQRMATELLLANQIIASKVSTDYLQANYIDADTINSRLGHFEEIDADYASFKNATITKLDAIDGTFTNLNTIYFQAETGKIAVLESDFATLKTVLAGNAAITDADIITLNASNAAIDSSFLRNTLINVLRVSDLAAGNISTNKFSVGSDDGRLNISGSLIQIKDANNAVRIQVGLDGSNNYSFSLFDGSGNPLWYNNGITEDAIPDNIIIDDMIADSGSGYSGISASKLNIDELWTTINNDGTKTINSTKIYMNNGQTLTQAYSQMSSDISSASGIASAAQASATASQAAAELSAQRARDALTAIEGISTLDAFGVSLTNDAHVIHTNTDGTGGDYTSAVTEAIALLGDTDVTDHTVFTAYPSSGITGSWNANTHRYYVTAMSGMDGYVDIEASYGIINRFLLMPDDKELAMPDGKILTIMAGSATVKKRFSLSKSPDGQIGIAYNLSCDVQVIRKNTQNQLSPASVTFSITRNNNTLIIPYYAVFVIEESTNDTTYTEKYRTASGSTESSKTYTPSSSSVRFIRCTAYDSNNNFLDRQSVIVLMDAEGVKSGLDTLSGQVQTISETVTTDHSRLGTVETGIEGLRVNLQDMTSEVHSVTDGNLRWEPYDRINSGAGTETITARLLNAKGENITQQYPNTWYTYYRRTEEERRYLGYGYSMTVNQSDMGYGGVIEAIFTTYGEPILLTPNGYQINLPNNRILAVYNNYE